METTPNDSEVLVPDLVIDGRFHTLFDAGRTSVRNPGATRLNRRQKFAATVFLVAFTIAALGVAIVVAVGAIVVVAALVVVGLIARLTIAIRGRTRH